MKSYSPAVQPSERAENHLIEYRKYYHDAIADTEDSETFRQESFDNDPSHVAQHTRPGMIGTSSQLHIEDSGDRQKPSKRPRPELTSASGITHKDMGNLDSQELKVFKGDLQHTHKQLGSKQTSRQPPYQYLTLYRLGNGSETPALPHYETAQTNQKVPQAMYFDPPQFTRGQNGQGVLRSQLHVTNFDLYLEQNKDISFVVYKTYDMPDDTYGNQGKASRHTASRDLSDAIVHESIEPVHDDLMYAVESLLQADDGYRTMLDDFRETSELVSPYLFVFYQRDEWNRVRQSLSESCQQQMAMLWDYIVQSHGAEYAAADLKIGNGMITPDLLKYLFKPGQLLVQRQDDGMQGWICTDWPKATWRAKKGCWKPDKRARDKSLNTGPDQHWELSAWHWEFDGEFKRKKATLNLSLESGPEEEFGIPINTLDIFPLRFASDNTIEQIRLRGRNFWYCRKRALVSYKGADTNENNHVGLGTYPKLSNYSDASIGGRSLYD